MTTVSRTKKETATGAGSPGGLRSAATLEIQTYQAQKLVTGREKAKGVEPIMGLLAFGQRMKPLWMAARNDDPYADWYLLRIEEAMNTSRKFIEDKTKWLDGVVAAMGLNGVSIEIACSTEPLKVPLQFANPYGYMGAYLVVDYDALARAALTARHCGLIDRSRSEEVLRGGARMIRRVFQYAAEWKYTGTVREDFRQMNQAAKRASDRMGELPKEVFEGRKRGRFAPDIRAPGKRLAGGTKQGQTGGERRTGI